MLKVTREEFKKRKHYIFCNSCEEMFCYDDKVTTIKYMKSNCIFLCDNCVLALRKKLNTL